MYEVLVEHWSKLDDTDQMYIITVPTLEDVQLQMADAFSRHNHVTIRVREVL